MSAPLASHRGQTVDRYEVGELLGQGGFGAVYRARHAVMKREVALKILWDDHARDPVHVERFLREARAAAAIGHPSIVRVLDAGRTPEGVTFLAMEMLEGRSLEDELRARGPLPVAEAVDVAAQVLDALGAAHDAGILHRDLKPGNVFLTTDGQVKLLDFGISKIGGEARLTATGMVLGTPQYMAPEQLDGRVVADHRADLYAAATLLYELLSGRLPYEGEGYDVVIRRLKGERAPRLDGLAPDVPPGLAAVVERGLALDRDARHPDAASLRAAILAAADGAEASLGELGVMTAPPRPSPLHGVRVPAAAPAATVGSGPVEARRAAQLASPLAPPRAPTGPTAAAWAPSDRAPDPPTRGSSPALAAAPARAPSPAPPSSAAAREAAHPRDPSLAPRPSAPSLEPARPSGPNPAPRPSAPALSAEAPPSPGHRWAWIGVAVLAVLLAGGVGVLGVLLFRLGRATGPAPEPRVEEPAPVALPPEPVTPEPLAPIEVVGEPVEDAPEPEPEPEPAPEDAPEDAPAPEDDTTTRAARLVPSDERAPEPAPRPPVEELPRPSQANPAAVRIQVTSHVGRGSRDAIDVVLRRARASMASCARRGQPTHVAVRFVATLGGPISIATPQSDRPSDDRGVALCVAEAIRRAGPADFPPSHTAIVTVEVDLPPG